VGIQPDSITPQIQAKAGIKIGISEKEFIKICKENGFLYSEMAMGEKVKYYAFSDNPDQRSSKMIMLGFSDGNLTSLMVINMIGD
jgi:hypothetical protein